MGQVSIFSLTAALNPTLLTAVTVMLTLEKPQRLLLGYLLGALVLVIVFVVATGRDTRRQAWSERKRERAKDKPPPRWRRQLSKGSARDTFVVGALLSFPGASYIAGMDLLHKQQIGTAATSGSRTATE